MAEFDPAGWEWWQAALRAAEAGNSSIIGTDALPIYDEPMTGFYRVRTHKGGPFIPVRIWYSGSDLKGMKNGASCEAVSIRGLWSHCSSHPISFNNYNAFIDSRKDPATPNGVWFDEIVTTVGDKTMSSQVAEHPAEEPAKRGRGRPRKNPADVEPVKPAVVEVEPDSRTEEQKGAFHINGEPMWARDGTLLDDKGNRSIFDDVDANGDDDAAEAEVDEWGDPIVRKVAAAPVVEKAPVEAPAPVERYWHRKSTKETFASFDDHSGDDDYREMPAENYRAILLLRDKPADTAPATPDEAETAVEPVNERAVIGNNSSSEFDQLKDEIDEWARIVKKLQEAGPAKTKAEADKVADARTKLGDLWKAMEALRKAEKKPHDDAAKAVQKKFVPILERAEIAGDATVLLLKPYLAEQRRIEEERVAEANRKAREEAEAARKAAEEFGDKAEETVVREVQAQKVNVGSRRGVGVVKRQVAVIEDPKAAMAYFAQQDPLHADFKDVLRKLGHKAMTGGISVPGMKMATEESLR